MAQTCQVVAFVKATYHGSLLSQQYPPNKILADARLRCVLNDREKSSIVSMVNISGSDEETIPLCRAVKATGNIEDWLGALEKGMQVNYSSAAVAPTATYAATADRAAVATLAPLCSTV